MSTPLGSGRLAPEVAERSEQPRAHSDQQRVGRALLFGLVMQFGHVLPEQGQLAEDDGRAVRKVSQ